MFTERISDLLLRISRMIAGLVFVYSGFVKGIDPLGSAYKFTDYFVAFNMEFMEPFALSLSFILSITEMLIGVALLTGVHMLIASWAVLLFMSFFTILTFIIALTDPVADCGCFGDAIILTNWETFWKNVALMIFVIYLFIKRKQFRPFFGNLIFEWTALAGLLIAIYGLFFYSYMNLPVIDYRPFSIGANIEEKMSVPPDAPADEYEIVLYYRKDGEIKAFSVDNLPATEWEWVRTESTLISKGYEPPVSNFFIESVDDGMDYTYDVLQQPGYTFILVAYNLDKSSVKNTGRINNVARWASDHGIDFICLTASPLPGINDFIERTGAGYKFYHTDEITLKTIIRSNPGLLLLKEGTILAKWHHRNIPHADEFNENLLSYSLDLYTASRHNLISYTFLLALLLIMALLKILRPKVNKPDGTPR